MVGHAISMAAVDLADVPFAIGFGAIGAATAWVFWLVAAYRNAWFTPPPEEAPEVRAARAERLHSAGVMAGQGAARLVGAARMAAGNVASSPKDGARKTPS